MTTTGAIVATPLSHQTPRNKQITRQRPSHNKLMMAFAAHEPIPMNRTMAALPPITAPAEVDVAVIGAGFGGLGAALHAAESGARVAIFESLSYPGGCASSFRRGNATYEAGATLFCGLGPNQPFGRWRCRHGLDVDFSILKTPVELRAPGLRLPVHSDKAAFIDQLCSLPDAPKEGIRRFFDI